ncbi:MULTISPECIES: hypothetical protein [unclassified Mesorhizobium]|uniref:hypothetical protein n=1 Tax=unclassified Mesorhizobium TaxID=325217 RepID=UPI00112EAB21|nr:MULTISPECIES: hypothetical protein [unclassified Mesorhizobium]TPK52910.1 hypothetical protein FJ550_14525 [Mesorhizobium sp. B2-5-2]TPL21342.1 hypothetical protein FJ946_21435 [Mesorhizobium sp. B2-4-7]TPL42955.1 hypothetical protein FJ961_09775 [Mesorhizobium sp. B2-4-5]TPM76916.1 hypothetical protein FJ968_04170 [Mesorhizobium sp. B2-1-6]TPN80052.1 hypothetical protein FJ985_02135 [Mesorhizobium sp. B1-1-2]
MSTSLPARAKALRERLVALDRLGANVEEASRLEGLRSDLAPPAAEFSRALDQRKLLVDSGIEAVAPAILDSIRKRATDLVEKFTAEKKAATLTRGVGWTNLIRDIKVASTELGAAVIQSWKVYRQAVFTGEAPGVIRGRIAFTPANSAAFAEYEQLHQAFRTEFDRLPADKAGIEKVRALAAKLTETAKAFDYNVPGEVKRFLEAIQSGGAALDLLTDTVKHWLRANNAFDSYRILPRSADGRR